MYNVIKGYIYPRCFLRFFWGRESYILVHQAISITLKAYFKFEPRMPRANNMGYNCLPKIS
jgi:hypothetical protein